jgi:UDP-N-acetylmuramoylalanine--D-glutamate ligase
VNDSKATNVNSAWYALESMEKPVVWIVGGVDKGNDYAILQDIVAKKVKAIVCLGIDNNRILENFRAQGLLMYEARSMEEAVALSYRAGKPGDVVLLSPACASFDLFKNYEERGDLFKEAVRGL